MLPMIWLELSCVFDIFVICVIYSSMCMIPRIWKVFFLFICLWKAMDLVGSRR